MLSSAVLVPPWPALGALLGALGAVWRLSWALGHLGAILKPQGAFGSEKSKKAYKNSDLP
eukprot:3271355-Pyramimonas_sp.AAC.1